MLRVEGSARCGGVPQGSGACQGQGNRKGRRGAGRCWQARDARAGSTIQARTSRRGGRRPVATRTPRTIGTRAAQVRGCTSQCFVSLILHGRQRPKRCRSAARKRRTRGVKMGCAPSQPKQKPPSPQKRDFREQLVWERSGRKFCEVYELLKDLNSGSFGTVALCRRKADGNRSIERTPSRNNLQRVKSESVFAMKALDYMRHNGRLRLDEATRNELRHEIDVLRKVDHPSIVHLREAFWEPTRLVLVMEYCEGRELAEFCGQLTESKVYKATEQILRAVSYLHARRVLHRDLKLENVMVTDQQDWHVTIVDFGLSRVFPQSLDGSRTGIKAAGTTSTAAPEVIRGEEYLMVSDVWSIGAMVYRLVGDRDPFLRDDRRDDPKALRRLEAGDCDWGRIATMSRPGRAFVFKCLRPHPALRWAADAALRYCAGAASGSPERMPRASTPPP